MPNLSIIENGSLATRVGSLTYGVAVHYLIVLRPTAGAYYLQSADLSTWTYLGVSTGNTSTPLYPSIQIISAAGTFGAVEMFDLPSPWNDTAIPYNAGDTISGTWLTTLLAAIQDADATATPTPTKTNTAVPATATNTAVPPTATYTPTVGPSPTPTNTAIPPTVTNTPLPPTATFTPVPPTATPTLPPTATSTPAYLREFRFADGSSWLVERKVSFGSMLVVVGEFFIFGLMFIASAILIALGLMKK